MAQTTRVKLREAIFQRFASVRYGDKYTTASHLFDMVSALNPGMRQLIHIRHLSPSDELATAVQRKVWSRLERLAEAAIDKLRKSGESFGPQKPPAKKLKFTPRKAGSDDEDFYFDDVPENPEGDDASPDASSATVAREAIEEYKTSQVTIPVTEAISLFRRLGRVHEPCFGWCCGLCVLNVSVHSPQCVAPPAYVSVIRAYHPPVCTVNCFDFISLRYLRSSPG